MVLVKPLLVVALIINRLVAVRLHALMEMVVALRDAFLQMIMIVLRDHARLMGKLVLIAHSAVQIIAIQVFI